MIRSRVVFVPGRRIELEPGRNTGTREHPCPECKSSTEQHFTFCRHYLLQQQYKKEDN